MTSHFGLGFWDYVIVVLVLVISTSIGIYYRFTGGKQKTMKEYLLANQDFSILPVAISLMASFMSAITILGVSGEIYSFGLQFILIYLGHLVFTPIAVYLYLPVFFKLQTTSAYEYLELRFGKTARMATSIAYILQVTLYTGVVIYAPALALEALTGISRLTAILSTGLISTFYSTIGGMKTVIMTDVFQSVLMFLSVLSIIVSAILSQGGLSSIWKIAELGNRTNIWNFDPDPTVRHSWFSLILGGGILYLSLYGVNQTQVQRYLTVRDLKSAQRALWLNWPIFCILGVTTSFSGLAIYSKYHDCDPIKAGYISSIDQLMPYYVVDTMGHIAGLAGLFVAGIFSATLSTISASLNSVSAVIMEDYYKPIRKYLNKPDLSSERATMLTKCIVLIYGLLCLGMTFLVQHLGAILKASLTIFGAIGGPVLGLFTLGMFTITANQSGSLIGFLVGMIVSMWISFAPKPPLETLPTSTIGCKLSFSNQTMLFHKLTEMRDYPWLYRVSYLYTGLIGMLVTFAVGFFLSLLIRKITKTPTYKETYDPNVFVQPLSNKLRRKRIPKSINLVEMSVTKDERDTMLE